MRDRNTFIHRHPLLVSSLVGLILGGTIGAGLLGLYIWQDPPVYPGGAYPSELTPNYQAHYLALVLDSYWLNGNAGLALERLKTFDQATQNKVLDLLAEYEGRTAALTLVAGQVDRVEPDTSPGPAAAAEPHPQAATLLNSVVPAGLAGLPLILAATAFVLASAVAYSRVDRQAVTWQLRKALGTTPQYVIGLDFGTTMSRLVGMKVEDLDEKPPREMGEILLEMPTLVIPIQKENTPAWLVGQEATNLNVKNPLIKLQMGQMKPITVNSPDKSGERKIRPEFLAAKLMAELRNQLLSDDDIKREEINFDKEFSDITVTVPVKRTPFQRLATRFAARVAGWYNVLTLEEPVAAFLYYRHYHPNLLGGGKYYLVFDFGGGTCDVSIIRWRNKKSWPRVIARSEERIGGEDIDEALTEIVGLRALGEEWASVSTQKKVEVRKYVKWSKEKLNPPDRSQKKDEVTSIETLFTDDEHQSLKFFSLSRDNLDEVIKAQEIIPKIERVLTKALKQAQELKEKGDGDELRIDKVLLIGGSSQLYAVQDFMEQFFKKNCRPLFSVGLAYQADLERSASSWGFRREFSRRNLSLSPLARITVAEPGSRWQISHGPQSFEVRKEDQRLTVYKSETDILFEEPMYAVAYGSVLHQYYSLRDGTAIDALLSNDIYIRYEQDNKFGVIEKKAYLGRKNDPLPLPKAPLAQIERMPFKIWYSLPPLRLPANRSVKNLSWHIYKKTPASEERIATIRVKKYKPGYFTSLRIVYRINEYGELELLAPYLINKPDLPCDIEVVRPGSKEPQPQADRPCDSEVRHRYDFNDEDDKIADKIRKEMVIL